MYVEPSEQLFHRRWPPSFLNRTLQAQNANTTLKLTHITSNSENHNILKYRHALERSVMKYLGCLNQLNRSLGLASINLKWAVRTILI